MRQILRLQPRPDATADEIDGRRPALAGLVGRVPGLLERILVFDFAL